MAVVTPPGLDPFSGPAPQRGDRLTFRDRVDAFITWLIAAVLQLAALAQNVYANALDAFASAQSAAGWASAAQAAAQAAVATPSAAGTSTTSLQLGFGAKSLTLGQTNKTFQLGQIVAIASSASPKNWMAGPVTAFTPGTGAMSVDVLNVGQETAGVYPTLASWIVSLAGAPAQTSQQQALSFVPVPMASPNMDLLQGERFTYTMNGNTNFTWSNLPAAPYGRTWVMDLTIAAGMPGFPPSIHWAGGITPSMLAGKRYKIIFDAPAGAAVVDAAVLGGYNS